jgi:hypothetical protein
MSKGGGESKSRLQWEWMTDPSGGRSDTEKQN